jgi:hypothetical protein
MVSNTEAKMPRATLVGAGVGFEREAERTGRHQGGDAFDAPFVTLFYLERTSVVVRGLCEAQAVSPSRQLRPLRPVTRTGAGRSSTQLIQTSTHSLVLCEL